MIIVIITISPEPGGFLCGPPAPALRASRPNSVFKMKPEQVLHKTRIRVNARPEDFAPSRDEAKQQCANATSLKCEIPPDPAGSKLDLSLIRPQTAFARPLSEH